MLGCYLTSNISHHPFETNNAIVWKVLVNGKDTQDEYELMDPTGIGSQQFDIYFNRAMDTNYHSIKSAGDAETLTIRRSFSKKGTWS
jgi:hypothetical protein